MRQPLIRLSVFIFATIIIILLSFPAVDSLRHKADLPIVVFSPGDQILIKKIHTENTGLNINDRIISIDGIPLQTREDIELIMDTREIGKPVTLEVVHGDSMRLVSINTIPFYSTGFIVLQSITALIFILIGFYVLIKCRGTKAAALFHLSTLGTAILLIMTWGKVSSAFDASSLARGLFQAAYVYTPLFFVHFALSFPEDKTKKHRILLYSLYAAGSLIVLLNLFTLNKTITDLSPASIDNFIFAFDLSRFFLAFCVGLSIAIFLIGYARTDDLIQRKKLKWLIMGFLVGPLSFIILWVIPQAVTDYGLVPEEFLSLLMLAVPLTFAISIVKYHLLDIDFIINRSIVYFGLIALIILIYSGLVIAAANLIHSLNRNVLSGLAALFVAFLFNPLKNSLKKFVDKKFFRIQYDFREAVTAFFSEIKNIHDINSLSDDLIAGISSLIPAQKTALMDISESGFPLVLRQVNFSESDFIFFKEKIFKEHRFNKMILHPEKTELPDMNFETEILMKDIGLTLIIPSLKMDDGTQFLLLMGNRKSGYKYSVEDIALLLNILNTAGTELSRIKLQQALVRKDLETEHLQELNKQKSLFVSSVSHELKTPLTSIKMYSEMLQINEQADKEKINTYAEYIVGESERLTRLIDNVLDFSRIEKGIKTYRKRPVDLTGLVKKSIELMEYQTRIKNFFLKTDIPDCDWIVEADPDALVEIFINLISNSIKYSADEKIIEIYAREEAEYYILEFSDAGIGIPEEDIEHLFSPFFRAKNSIENRIPGTGLGLSIIKHIADAHGIGIEVVSKLGAGTTFVLKIPKYLKEEHYEKDPVN